MLNIEIFELGSVHNIDFTIITKMINISKKDLKTIIKKPILDIGDADLSDIGYSDSKLFSKFPKNNSNNILVGITSRPLEDNYYTRTDSNNNFILITLHETDELIEKTGATREDVIVVNLLSVILSLQYKGDPYHDETRGCIFDFCRNKIDMVHQLKFLRIEDDCREELIKGGVSKKDIEIVEKILNKIKNPSLLRSVVISLKNPIFNFFLGGVIFGLVINVLSTLILGDFNSLMDYYLLIILAVLIICLFVGNYFYLKIKTKKLQERI